MQTLQSPAQGVELSDVALQLGKLGRCIEICEGCFSCFLETIGKTTDVGGRRLVQAGLKFVTKNREPRMDARRQA